MTGLTLNHIHLQRLRPAVAAVRAGVEVRFRINSGEPSTLVWYRMDRPSVQHVVLNSFGSDLYLWKEAVEQEFERLIRQPRARSAS